MHLDALEKHLAVLKRSGYVQTWHDCSIQPGEVREQKIEMYLSTADVILLLISHDFLASDYYWDAEMQLAAEKHRNGEAHLVPIILSPCDYQGTLINDFQVLPTGGKAITLWSHRQEAYADIAKNIRALVEKLLAQKWKRMGDMYNNQRYYEQALSAYKEAFRFDPYILSLCVNMGKLLIHFNHFEEAIAAYKEAIQLDPHNPYLYEEKGEALLASNVSKRRLLHMIKPLN